MLHTRSAPLFLALVGLALAQPAAATSIAHVEARRDGDALVVHAVAELHAPRSLTWAVLTDYDHYAEFVPELNSSRIISRSAEHVVVEQRGTAQLMLYRLQLEIRLVCTEELFTEVRCRATAGSFRQLEGEYRLLRASNGIRLTYRGRLVPNFSLPPIFGMFMLRASLERQFKGLVGEITRRSSGEIR